MEFLKNSWNEYLEFIKKMWNHHKTALVVVIVIFEILMLSWGFYLYQKTSTPLKNENNTTKVKNG
jgi:predicted negative regulator of RcsB-dependent stress response